MREIILEHKEIFMIGMGVLILLSLVAAIFLLLMIHTKKNTPKSEVEEKKKRRRKKYRKQEGLSVRMELIRIHCLIQSYMMLDMMFM